MTECIVAQQWPDDPELQNVLPVQLSREALVHRGAVLPITDYVIGEIAATTGDTIDGTKNTLFRANLTNDRPTLEHLLDATFGAEGRELIANWQATILTNDSILKQLAELRRARTGEDLLSDQVLATGGPDKEPEMEPGLQTGLSELRSVLQDNSSAHTNEKILSSQFWGHRIGRHIAISNSYIHDISRDIDTLSLEFAINDNDPTKLSDDLVSGMRSRYQTFIQWNNEIIGKIKEARRYRHSVDYYPGDTSLWGPISASASFLAGVPRVAVNTITEAPLERRALQSLRRENRIISAFLKELPIAPGEKTLRKPRKRR